MMVIFPLVIVTMLWNLVIQNTLMLRWRWFKIFMEEVEFCFFSLCHLLNVMMLAFHSVFEFSPVWSVTKVWSGDPIIVVSINLNSVRSGVPFFMDFSMSTIHRQLVVLCFMRGIVMVVCIVPIMMVIWVIGLVMFYLFDMRCFVFNMMVFVMRCWIFDMVFIVMVCWMLNLILLNDMMFLMVRYRFWMFEMMLLMVRCWICDVMLLMVRCWMCDIMFLMVGQWMFNVIFFMVNRMFHIMMIIMPCIMRG